MISFTGTYTDHYQLTMAETYYLKGHHEDQAVFDYFFRKIPFGGGFAIFAGLDPLLKALEQLTFKHDELEFLEQQGMSAPFLDYLKTFRFRGTIRSVDEGDLIFPTRPVLQIEATIVEAQIIETLLLNLLNLQTLIATKAARMKLVAGERKLIDFGLRRAHGPGGYYASRAAVVGGFEATSNVAAGKDFGIPISGTMAHSFVQSYDREIDAFRDFASVHPDNTVLLVDTYDTLRSGLPNAITIAKEMEESGHRLKGIRLDSGDLAWLARESRRMLDEAGLPWVQIAASNQLDEHVIKSLLDQQAPVDIFGVGTSLVTGRPDAALDGVYKLSWSQGRPRIKLSDSLSKVTLPDRKQVYRMLNSSGELAGADAITLMEEEEPRVMHHPFDPLQSLNLLRYEKVPLLKVVMESGEITRESPSLAEHSRNCLNQLALLPSEYKRFQNPHIYKVGISEALKQKRDQLVLDHEPGRRGSEPVS